MTGPLIVAGLLAVGGLAVAIGEEFRYQRQRKAFRERMAGGDHPDGFQMAGLDPYAPPMLMGRYDCAGRYRLSDDERAVGKHPALGAPYGDHSSSRPDGTMIGDAPVVAFARDPDSAMRSLRAAPAVTPSWLAVAVPVRARTGAHPAGVHIGKVVFPGGEIEWGVYDGTRLIKVYTRRYTASVGARRLMARQAKALDNVNGRLA